MRHQGDAVTWREFGPHLAAIHGRLGELHGRLGAMERQQKPSKWGWLASVPWFAVLRTLLALGLLLATLYGHMTVTDLKKWLGLMRDAGL